jgi:hypothetical protein
MTPLMPKRTVWMKWVLPYVLILAVFAWTFYDERPRYISAGLVLISMLVIMFYMSKRENKHMPDQVLDGGSFLQVHFGPVTEHIPLSNVLSMDAQKFIRVTCIVLRLREPASFGDTITFYPFQDRDASGHNAVAVSLQGRISDANV